MRKIMCLVLTVICLLVLAGCGGGTKNAEAPVQKQAAEKCCAWASTQTIRPLGIIRK